MPTTKSVDTALFIFRRDLRISDNLALNFLLECGVKNIYAVFCLDPRQLKSGYSSGRCIKFMHEALADLAARIPVTFLFGKYEHEIKHLYTLVNPDVVCYNADYTPFSVARDKKLRSLGNFGEKVAEIHGDLFCGDYRDIDANKVGGYKVFTPFYKVASKLEISPCDKSHALKPLFRVVKGYKSVSLDILERYYNCGHNLSSSEDTNIIGSRKMALELMNSRHLRQYARRDYFSYKTSRLSAYLKFGIVSPREVIAAARKNRFPESFIRQLYWRDFYLQLIKYNDKLLQGQVSSKPNADMYDRAGAKPGMMWRNDKKEFAAWKQGKTGVPMVDANMRCLNATGFMPNRGRMIVAMYLTKILLIDWRWGEKYFAQKLIDYDPASNNGGWQWAASTGADSTPYFRVINPWLQGLKYDKNAEFIKKWVPELRDVPAKIIHNGKKFSPKKQELYEKRKKMFMAMFANYAR